MSKRYGGAANRGRAAREALAGVHWIASTPCRSAFGGYEVGDSVRIVRNKAETTIVEKTKYGFVLEGYNGYFLAADIVKLGP